MPAFVVRFYQDTGWPDDNSLGGIEDELLSQGFVLGLDLMSVTAEGGEHSATSWEHRFPNALRFLFPP